MGKNATKGQKKPGRNKDECALYRSKRTKERNQLVKIRKHISTHPGDARAEDAVERIQSFTGLK